MTQAFAVYAGTWRALYRLHGAAAWPPAPDGTIGIGPDQVFLGSYGKDEEPLESILIGTATASDPQTWATTGLTRNAKFSTQVFVKTGLRDRSPLDTLDRLEALTQVAETLIITAMRPGNKPSEIPSAAWSWGITSIDTGLGPNDAGTFAGSALFTIAVTARIGGY